MPSNTSYFGEILDFVSGKGDVTNFFAKSAYAEAVNSIRKRMAAATCKICYARDHSTGMCPEYQDNLSVPFNNYGDFSPWSQTWYDPNPNGYDQGWWDNSGYNYTTRPMNFQQYESQESSFMSSMSFEEIVEPVATNTYQFQQETQMGNEMMQDAMSYLADQLCLLTSKMNRLASQREELPSKTIVDLEENESAICLTSNEEMQEGQNEKSADAVEKEAENEEMEPQPQPIQVNESSEQSPNAVTSSPLLNQYFPDSYSSIPVTEIDFIIPENLKFHDRNKLRVAMEKYLEPKNACDGGVNGECKLSLTCLAPSTSPWKTVARVLKDYSIYEGYQDHIEDEVLKRATRFYPP
ncbi:uncharacterized protein [Coffea arabica]|uniref:Uncharacterized protein n=1 Tax=Coffea arabica TaxID=13443 RepID=A0ABM4U4K5_COFAR